MCQGDLLLTGGLVKSSQMFQTVQTFKKKKLNKFASHYVNMNVQLQTETAVKPNVAQNNRQAN